MNPETVHKPPVTVVVIVEVELLQIWVACVTPPVTVLVETQPTNKSCVVIVLVQIDDELGFPVEDGTSEVSAVVDFGLSSSSVCGGGGLLQSPETRMPNILTQGKWNFGKPGNPGIWNDIFGISGRFHITIPLGSGPHPGHPTMTGRIVDDLSCGPEVVSQVLVDQP